MNQEIVPEFEKLSNAAEVSIAGGSDDFIRVEVIPEQMLQYGLSLSSIVADIQAAEVELPGGSVSVGRRNAAISTRMSYDTEEALKDIPLTVPGRDIVYLQDVANIYTTQDANGSIAHYNGSDTVSLSITKQQSSTAAALSKEVRQVVEDLTGEDASLEIHIVNDSADDIRSSLYSIAETIILAMALSMAVIWLFFGDLKASLIVGSSIPVSILSALICMKRMDFSLNMLTLAALSLGVGMMVDNSIVVLESCMRCKEEGMDFREAAATGTATMLMSILAGTLTTVVVYIPMAMADGLVGMMTGPRELDHPADPAVLLPVRCGGGPTGLPLAQAPDQGSAYYQPHPGPVQGLLPPDPAPAAAPPRAGGAGGRRLLPGRHPADDPDGICDDGQQL